MSSKDFKHDIFISYRREDSEWTRKLYEQLRKLNIQPWIDEQKIQPGQHWKELIDAAIKRATIFTTNYDTLLEQALFQETPDLNLPDQVDQATDLELPPSKIISAVESIASVDTLSVELIAYLKEHKHDLEKLKWDVFEHLVAEFLASRGFNDVRLVGRDPLTSADIFAVHTVDSTGDRIRFFVEVKRTSTEIGISVVNEVLGAFTMERPKFGWDVAMIISLAGFKELRKISNDDVSLFGVRLKDRADLERWLDGYSPNGTGLWLPDPSRLMSA